MKHGRFCVKYSSLSQHYSGVTIKQLMTITFATLFLGQIVQTRILGAKYYAVLDAPQTRKMDFRRSNSMEIHVLGKSRVGDFPTPPGGGGVSGSH